MGEKTVKEECEESGVGVGVCVVKEKEGTGGWWCGWFGGGGCFLCSRVFVCGSLCVQRCVLCVSLGGCVVNDRTLLR